MAKDLRGSKVQPDLENKTASTEELPFEGRDRRLEFRELETEAAKAELRLRLPELQDALAQIGDAQTVPHETLQLEFSI